MRNRVIQLFKSAIHNAFPEVGEDFDPMIQRATRPEFGDYQANFAMRLSKQLHLKPADIAATIIEKLQENDAFQQLEISGPGFINITIKDHFISEILTTISSDDRLGIAKIANPEVIVVDYANANVAKEMHVGHIRSIVLGDAIVRILDFLGHSVIKQSHLGDWGTQFGMLIEYLFEAGIENNLSSVSELDQLYKASKKRFDEDPNFADKARTRVVALQSGDKITLQIWDKLVKESLQYFQTIYNKLDVLVTEEDARGESFYNPMLKKVVQELLDKKIATINDGAVTVFLDQFNAPFIIQKKDGGYLYATTDIAAAKFRIEILHATRLIYLTDARQKQHFAMLFSVLKETGWLKNNVRLEHIPFGSILGKDNKPFKTRTGESIKLITLLEEAEERAKKIALEKNPDLNSEELEKIAHVIGIGALKYADLRADKIKDYVFDWDKLLSFEGNTAPYLQNAYVRISAIFRRGQLDIQHLKHANIVIQNLYEHRLAIAILEFNHIIHSVADNLYLHTLCDYLYDLASLFHQFYEHCPMLNQDNLAIRDSRLLLSHLAGRTIKLGLNLLGINTISKM